MVELFRSDNVLVRRIDGEDTRRCVITFDNYGIGHGFDRKGFGEQFLSDYGITAIHVMGRREDWYQYPEMLDALAAVRRSVAGMDRVMTYGSSMGAYAAVRFADAVGANAVLALSPQYSLDPAKARHDRRWAQDSFRIAWRPELDGPIRSQARPVVVYDPTILDRWHADTIAGDIEIQPIALRHTDHPAATYLAEVGMLVPLVFETLDGVVDVVQTQKLARERRASSGVYLSALARKQPKWRRNTALNLGRRAVAVREGNPIAMVNLARLLMQAGEHDEGLALHASIFELTQGDIHYLVTHAEDLITASRHEQAAIHARAVVGMAPHMAHVQGWAAVILWAANKREEAQAYTRRAIALDPHNLDYQDMLDAYRAGRVYDPAARRSGWPRARRWIRRISRPGGVAKAFGQVRGRLTPAYPPR